MIPTEYEFATFSEFYHKRNKVKTWYVLLSTDDKYKVRYYVYSRFRIVTNKSDPYYFQDLIWDYLNDFRDDETLENIYRWNGGCKV